MPQASDALKKFFSELEMNGNTLNLEGLEKAYADVFGFADAQGFKMVTKKALLKALPQRKNFVDSIGLKSTKFLSIDEEKLDGTYVLARVVVVMHFEKAGRAPIDDQDSTVYILRKKGESFEIVFHLESRGLMEKINKYQLSPHHKSTI